MSWAGAWVTRELGLTLGGEGVRELLGLAVRRNENRAHLLVSTVLGKHIPQRPAVVRGAGRGLGERVRELLGDRAARAVVLGYAETATALGHNVADGMGGVPYLHSTRRAVPGAAPAGGFQEEHSHSTSHLLLPADTGFFARGGPLVLVDDELSTGRTVANTLAALHRRWPRDHYVLATLVDVRSPRDAAALEQTAARLGARVDVVAAARGSVTLPGDVLERGRRLVREREPVPAPPDAAAPAPAARVPLPWPPGLPDGGRHGFTGAHARRLDAALPALAAPLADALPAGGAGRVLVLGTEELMYVPLRLASALDEAVPGAVYFSSTTRSPVLPVDDPGYAVRSRLAFPAHDGEAGERFVHNVAGGGWDAVVVVTDSVGDTPALHAPGGLLDVLSRHTPRVLLAVVPARTPEPLRGPGFSSYRPEDVGWLLQDLSDVPLEAPVEEREEAVQRRGAHYAESLPVEYRPDAAYRRLFHQALDASAGRIAQAVATVTDTLLAERGGGRPVLASLARAGTPVGVLMRRWAAYAHGVDLPHYTLSIVRGRGIDTAALRWLADHYDPSAVVFVDGWTGKGAITRELADALRDEPAFDPSLAVLADPGGCVGTFGTREDFLIPSACLNSTVSGLISRTVLRPDLVGPHDFHGAKFYRELSGADVSRQFLDAVAARFADAVPGAMGPGVVRAPTWEGWRAVERVSEEYGIGDVNLVKPGVGETTRVLLRRVPWRVLVRPDAGPEVDHIRLLAAQRGAPVEERADLPYRSVGLIHPRYSRGATGADGRAAV